MRFRTTIELGGKTATGFPVPDDVIAGLGSGKRPAVVVRVGGYEYRTIVGSMGGRAMIPLSAEHRAGAGVAAGDEIDVELTLDTAPRVIATPDDLAAALAPHPQATAYFDGLSFSHRRAYVDWIESAKKAETRTARVEQAVAMLRERRTR